MTGVTGKAAAVLLLALASVAAAPSDWPEFRGPTGQGLSRERGLPLQWSEARNIVWKSRQRMPK